MYLLTPTSKEQVLNSSFIIGCIIQAINHQPFIQHHETSKDCFPSLKWKINAFEVVHYVKFQGINELGGGRDKLLQCAHLDVSSIDPVPIQNTFRLFISSRRDSVVYVATRCTNADNIELRYYRWGCQAPYLATLRNQNSQLSLHKLKLHWLRAYNRIKLLHIRKLYFPPKLRILYFPPFNFHFF